MVDEVVGTHDSRSGTKGRGLQRREEATRVLSDNENGGAISIKNRGSQSDGERRRREGREGDGLFFK